MTIGFSYFFGSNVFRAQVLMCDGSVRFIDASVPPSVLAPLCTRANGDSDTLID